MLSAAYRNGDLITNLKLQKLGNMALLSDLSMTFTNALEEIYENGSNVRFYKTLFISYEELSEECNIPIEDCSESLT